MGALDQLESCFQDLVERPAGLLMSKRFRPVQLATAITRELEDKAQRLADRIVVPNSYTIHLAPDDYRQIEGSQSELERELAEYVERLAAERAFSLPADPEIHIVVDRLRRPGDIDVAASLVWEPAHGSPRNPLREMAKARAALAAVEHGRSAPGDIAGSALGLLDPDGRTVRRFPIQRRTLTLGRRSSNDVSLPDTNVSRHHARLDVIGSDCFLTDLNSTNGTRINGEAITERSPLQPGDVIQVGLQQLRFEAAPQSSERGP